MDTKHTPGPWNWREGYRGLDGPGGAAILRHESYEGMWLPDYEGPWAEANARLIAAAPELLARLRDARERLLDMLEGDDGQAWDEAEKALPLIDAAIAKATGQ